MAFLIIMFFKVPFGIADGVAGESIAQAREFGAAARDLGENRLEPDHRGTIRESIQIGR